MHRATTLSPLWRRKILSSSSPTVNNRNIFPSISTLSSSATLINQQQQQPAVSFVSAVKSRSYRHYTHHHHQQRFSSWEYYSALTAAAAAAASAVLLATTTSFSTTTTRCDDDDDDDNNSNNNKSNEIETDTEIDPYDNLPEKDEPTNCSICLTYRQVSYKKNLLFGNNNIVPFSRLIQFIPKNTTFSHISLSIGPMSSLLAQG